MNWRRILFRFFWSRNTNIIKNYDWILAEEFCSKEELKSYQKAHLDKLLLYAYNNCPYYKRILAEAGVINNSGQVCFENFINIHPLTKDIIREQFADLKASNLEGLKWEKNTSGGSTGEPVAFIQDEDFRDWRWANKLFFFHLAGKEIGDKELKLWGSERDILEGSIGVKSKLENFAYNRHFLNSFRMTPGNMNDYISTINQFRPKLIWTYVDSIHELSKYILKNDIRVFSPKSIVTTAGVLTEDVQSLIKESFPKSSVYNQYGSREVGDIACECDKHEGLHIFEHTHYVEILDKELTPVKPGEMGDIYVTLLTNYAMPLIRYKIGDTGVWGEKKCSCGRPFRLLKKVTGRTTDHFYKEDGTIIHGEYFTHCFYHKDWVKRFQVIQEEYGRIVCYVVLNGERSVEDEETILGDIKKIMGEDCFVEFKFVEEIKPSKSGKYLYTLSKIKDE